MFEVGRIGGVFDGFGGFSRSRDGAWSFKFARGRQQRRCPGGRRSGVGCLRKRRAGLSLESGWRQLFGRTGRPGFGAPNDRQALFKRSSLYVRSERCLGWHCLWSRQCGLRCGQPDCRPPTLRRGSVQAVGCTAAIYNSSRAECPLHSTPMFW